jgi:hypothetical protein
MVSPVCNVRSTTSLEVYDMKSMIQKNPLPPLLPFLADTCATIIPESCDRHTPGAMDDVIAAIRATTRLITPENHFTAPTTIEIQEWLSSHRPEKYPASKENAAGWRNTVNQCLTHGQGWNFLTYPPVEGSKNKRHLLFERAFNGTYIVGSGQCKGLNDLKPKKRLRASERSISKARQTASKASGHQNATVPPLGVTSNVGDVSVPTASEPSSAVTELEMLEMTLTNMKPAPPERSLNEIEGLLMEHLTRHRTAGD